MAAKGSIAKAEITQKILETFPGSFINDKEIRVNWKENGEPIQIKVTLTAAKEMIGEIPESDNGMMVFEDMAATAPEKEKTTEMSKEELDNVQKLINMIFK